MNRISIIEELGYDPALVAKHGFGDEHGKVRASDLSKAVDIAARFALRVAELEAALKEAIDLRVRLYRHSGMDGDADTLTDPQVTLMDPFAKKWAPLVNR